MRVPEHMFRDFLLVVCKWWFYFVGNFLPANLVPAGRLVPPNGIAGISPRWVKLTATPNTTMGKIFRLSTNYKEYKDV